MRRGTGSGRQAEESSTTENSEREIPAWKLLCVLLAALTLPILVSYGAYKAVHDELTFDFGINGLQPDDSIEARHARAIEAASDWCGSHHTGPKHDGGMPSPPPPPAGEDGDEDDGSSEGPPETRHRVQSKHDRWLNLAIETVPPGGDVSADNAVAVLAAAEHAVQSFPGYEHVCLAELKYEAAKTQVPGCQDNPPWDAPACNATLLQCKKPISPRRLPNETAIDNIPFIGDPSKLSLGQFLSLLTTESLSTTIPSLHSPVGYFFDKDYAHGETSYPVAMRTVFPLAMPLEGYKRADMQFYSQQKELVQWLLSAEKMLRAQGTSNVAVYFTARGLTEEQMRRVLLSDLRLAALSGIVMVACLAVFTRSVPAAIAGVATAFLAFPSAFALYVASGQRYVSWLHGVLPFIWLGLGVDDVLVMNSCMHSSGFAQRPTNRKLSIAVQHAARTMIPTSITTATVFGSLAFRSLLPPVRSMGVLAVFVVVADIILVFALIPTSHALSTKLSRFFLGATDDSTENERIPLKVNESSSFSADDLRSTVASEEDSFIDEESEEKHDRSDDHPVSDADNDDDTGRMHRRKYLWRCRRLMDVASIDLSGFIRVGLWLRRRMDRAFNAIERFASNVLTVHAGFVRKHWHVIICASLILGLAASVSIGVLLQPATQAPQLLRDGHFLRRVRVLFWDILYTSDHTDITLAFGVKNVDESDSADPNTGRQNQGVPVWDDDFDASNKRSQIAMLSLCETIASNAERLGLKEANGFEEMHTCAIQRFNRYLQHVKDLELPLEPERFNNYFAEFHENVGTGDRTELAWWGNEVLFLKERFKSPLMARSSTMKQIENVYKMWEQVIGEHNTSENGTHARAIHASDLWMRVGYKRSVKSTAQLAPGVTLTASMIAILISTLSLAAAGAAVVSLVHAVLWVLAILVLCGWHFGVLETISLTLMIGSSIDYCIHLSSSWYIFGDLQRALKEAVPTVLAAVSTTIISASFLLACTILVFADIGFVLVLSSAFGVLASVFTFPALLFGIDMLIQHYWHGNTHQRLQG